jgi:uncharacterized transporter YbjL
LCYFGIKGKIIMKTTTKTAKQPNAFETVAAMLTHTVAPVIEKAIHITGKTLAAITGALNADATSANKWVIACDMLRAEKVTSAMLQKKTGDEAVREQVKIAIIASFTADKRKLLNAEHAALSEADKTARKAVQQSIGAYMAKVYAHMIRAENVESGVTDKKERGARVTVTPNARITASLDAVITKAQALKEPSFSIPEFIKAIRVAKALIK